MSTDKVSEILRMTEQDKADWQLIAPGRPFPVSRADLLKVGKEIYNNRAEMNARDLGFLATLAEAASRLGLTERTKVPPTARRIKLNAPASNDPT